MTEDWYVLRDGAVLGPIGVVGGAIAGFFGGGKVVKGIARREIHKFIDELSPKTTKPSKGDNK